MIKLSFKPRAIFALKVFIRHYEEAFFELYEDSGLWNENLIIESYKQSAKRLYKSILDEIKKRLLSHKVLGRKAASGWNEIDFYVGNRLIVVHFSEKRKATRQIESIFIDRKPIIF